MTCAPAPPIDRRALARTQRRLLAQRQAAVHDVDFLHERVAQDMAARIAAVNRKFDIALDIGDRFGHAARALAGLDNVVRIVSADVLAGTTAPHGIFRRPELICDDERLPFGIGRLSVIVSTLSLQFVNDLPGALLQMRQALRPDGAFFAVMVGGRSLYELRESLIAAELDQRGGASARMLPFVELASAGDLLRRAGFALPVVDRETVYLRYPSMHALIADLRQLGWSNCLTERARTFTARGIFDAAAQYYAEHFGESDGRVRASFELVYLLGWSAHESQQKPLARGSANVSLAKILGDKR